MLVRAAKSNWHRVNSVVVRSVGVRTSGAIMSKLKTMTKITKYQMLNWTMKKL